MQLQNYVKSVKFSSGMEYKSVEISSASGGLPHPNYVKL